jgi:VIT1/CCC1 family predicted Fe2+/Mn2+ transporter
VDGVMYAVTSVLDRSRATAIRDAIRAGDPARANGLLRAALPESLIPLVDDGDLDAMRLALADAPAPPGVRLLAGDVRTALVVAALVFVSTLPLVLPFVLVPDVRLALRVSNAVALAMLFGVGVEFGRHAGLRPLWTGVAMLALGVGLVAATVALGG